MPDMPQLSVSLPRLSTVNLPRARKCGSGYPTAMDRQEILAWIDARKKVRGIKADSKVAKEAGHPDVIRNIRRGISMPKMPALKALAKVLGDPPPGLFDFTEPKSEFPTIEEMQAERDEYLRRADDLRIAIEVLQARFRKVR